MVRIYRPGETLTASGKLIDQETGQPITGATIQLQQRDVTTGEYDIVSSTTTRGDGTYSVSFTLPRVEGTVNLRLYFPGSASYSADASPPLNIQIKQPKAARTRLSVTVA